MKTLVELEIVCPFCGETHYVVADLDGFNAWRDGDLAIQNALPQLSPTEREQLISRMCPRCQADFFAPPADEDEDLWYLDDEDEELDV